MKTALKSMETDMALVYYVPSNTITPITGYNYVADLQYGSDGQGLGAPELDAGTATSKVAENATWDGNPEDGVDSGWLAASYIFQAGTKGLTWGTNNAAAPLKYNVGTVPSLKQITLRAGVQNQAAMFWRSAVVKFYNGSTLRETVSLSDFGADYTSGNNGTIGEEVVRILPGYTDTNRATVSAQVRMTCPAGVYLDSYDAFSQVFAFVGTRQMSSMTAGSDSSSLEVAPITSVEQTVQDVPATTPFSDQLLGVDTAPDMLQSGDPTVL
jgi:hypothetical protein